MSSYPPSDVKYPSVSMYLNKSATVYPVSGKSILTGPEYVLAKNQGCSLDISYIFQIPFKGQEDASSRGGARAPPLLLWFLILPMF